MNPLKSFQANSFLPLIAVLVFAGIYLSGCKGSEGRSKYDLENGILVDKDYYDRDDLIGRCKFDLKLGFPQGTMSNFIADGVLDFGKEVFDEELDFAMIDNSVFEGELKEGEVTGGTIIDLLPVDPTFVAVTFHGSDLKTIITWIVTEMETHGDPQKYFPISGLNIHLLHTELKSIRIGTVEIDDKEVYKGIIPAKLVDKKIETGFPVKPIQLISVTQGLRELLVRYFREHGLPVRPQADLRFIQEF